jgi:hypothetical protein
VKRIVLLLAIATTTPACDLLLNPSSHQGHGHDTGSQDGSVAVRDVGPTDSGPDAWAPPECTTATDCGAAGTAGLVQCVSHRCVFCATPAATMPREIRHGSVVRPYVSIGVRTRPTGPALVLVGTMTTGNAAPSLAHALPIDLSAATVDVPVIPAVSATCSGATITSVSDIDFYPDPNSVSTNTTVGVIAQTATDSIITQVDWLDTGTATSTSHAMCNTQPLPATYDATTAVMISPDSSSVPHTLQMVRSSDGTGNFSYLGFDIPGAARSQYYNGFQSPTGTYALLTSAGPFMVLGAVTNDRVIWWDPVAADPQYLMTPGRTGDPVAALLSGTPMTALELLHFVAAYPVGNTVRFVDVDCTGGCNPVGQANDVATGSMAVTAVRFGLASGVPVMLTSEHLASGGEQVVLRVLRANDTPFDAPMGGSSLVLDTAPSGSTISDIQLAIVGGTMTRYAAVWVVTGPTGSSVRVQTFLGSC